ncbi:PAS domain-containing hybrid sensor histidine kinase/response regulator [Fimbriiglobus ruber]|uniref:histidine kinase n=1 Tax=Fimbriiglobus ruber TaxID=1908690 RepID=A0A225E165_9BACT|nr:PAS domain S-box protein [Fimbriiglobus ruber]OWK47460.1 multi-sensor hybrid histidine kinase [Fimbriiglobus ruber]
MFEVTPNELSRMWAARAIPFVEEDEPAFYQSVEAALARHAAWSHEFHTRGKRTGRIAWFQLHAFPSPTTVDDSERRWTLFVVDITPLKETKARLRQAYQTLSSHIDNTPLAVIEWDREFRVRRWSGQATAIFGWTSDEVIGKHPSEWRFIHVEDASYIAGMLDKFHAHVEPRNVIVNRNYHKSGAVLVCEWHNSALTTESGETWSVLSLVLDVTERSRAADELAKSEERLRASLRSAGMLGWEYDVARMVTVFSGDFAVFHGIPHPGEPLTPDRAILSVHPEDRERVQNETSRAALCGGEIQIEFRGPAPAVDGRPRWFESRATVVKDQHGQLERIVGVTAEVTARKRAEEERAALDKELQVARQRESLGLLAGGIAHDFNNILTVILGNAGLIGTAAAGGVPVGEFVQQIETACHRAAELCKQMSAFAGVGRFLVQQIDLNRVIREATTMLRMAAGHRARVVLELSPAPLPRISADPLQIRQLLHNLVVNASEALGAGTGDVRLATADVVVPGQGEWEVRYSPSPKPGRAVLLTVSDSGHGMTAEVLSRAFEPFYSTKFTGRGLGLPAVQGIARSHRASVGIQSTPFTGTRVEILFPADVVVRLPAGSARLVAPTADTPAWRGTGKVLVADDEPNVRELAASVLEEIGFEVVAADDGARALAAFRVNPSNFRLAVLDLVMPGMSGTELMAAIRALIPDLPVVIMSGFANTLPEPARDDATAPVLLDKPFRIEHFIEAVRTAYTSRKVVHPGDTRSESTSSTKSF